MFNIYFLIGHGGSGKSLYGKSVEECFDNKDSSIRAPLKTTKKVA